jgi:diaminopimelate epimerase
VSGARRSIPFTKMHGAGNDFVVLDGIAHELPPLEAFARRIGHRNFGIGCDQTLVVRRPRDPESADFRMEIYNRDGSQVEMCGNGIRALFKFLRDRGYTGQDSIRIETLGGVVVPRWAGRDQVEVDMGRPVLEPAKIPIALEKLGGSGIRTAIPEGPVLDVPLDVVGREVIISSVSMGNPHAVVVVDDVETAPVATLGPAIERHPAFPAGTNVEFIQIVGRDRIRQRTWERGTGETLACGSGACAATVTSMLRGVADAKVAVELRGGELEIAWEREPASVFMTGPSVTVFTGEIPAEEN